MQRIALVLLGLGLIVVPSGCRDRKTATLGLEARSATPAEKEWGEAIDGVQVALHVPNDTWEDGHFPALTADLRNAGNQTDLFLQGDGWSELEVDDVWYAWWDQFGNFFFHGDFDTPFHPGTQFKQNDLPASGRLSIGKHIVRAAIPVSKNDGKTFRVLSNPVVIEVRAASSVSGSATATELAPGSDIDKFDARKVAAKVAAEIKKILPQGWTMETEQNIITISRDRPVGWYNVNSRGNFPTLPDGVTPLQPDAETSELVRVEIAAPLDAARRAAMVKENRRTLTAFRKERKLGERLKGDPEPPRQSMYRVPDILAQDYSAYMSTLMGGAVLYYSKADEGECEPVVATIRDVVGRHALQQP